MRSLKRDLELLISSVKQIKESSIIGAEKEDGEIIKLLIETKFNSVIRVSILIMSISSSFGNASKYIYDFIKEKLIGLGPLKIKFVNELYDFIRAIEKEVEVNELETIIPVNIVAYQNTVFCFEERQYILEVHSKNIKAYLDKDGQIVVEKFVF